MSKRVLSLFLCLLMVLGVVTPVVNAADLSLGDSAINFDNVTYSNITIDGNTVNSTTSVTPPTQLGGTSNSTTPLPATAPACDCGNVDKDIIVHSDSCMLKKYYQGVCKLPSVNAWAMWSDLSADAREYILAYLSWTDHAKLQELERQLLSGAFAEDSIVVNGTEITALNVPEYGSLKATTPSASAQTAVEQYASKMGYDSANKLFQWDISVQTTSGQEWQPNGTDVKLELDVPGAKLHKYAKVYVVHVDDNGVASTIEAEVTADGKIAFKTPGFSTFAAFTVDFAFNGAEFSIPGETSIKLSEVFDQLKMPLFVEDVASVTFTNYDLVTVEKQPDGDWLLTSLVEFHTDEKLTVTMNDGQAYVIDVTDATYVTISYNKSGNLDGGDFGVVEWYLHDSSAGGKAYSAKYGSNSAPGWTEDYDIYIDGTNATKKDFEIVLQRHGYASGRTLYVDLHTVWIKGGANLIFRLGASITKDNTDQIIVRQVRGYHNDTYGDEWWFGEMFWVENGSLELRVPYTAVDKGGDGGNVHEGVQMVLDWDSDYNNVPSGNGPKALVSLRQNASSFKANQCVFRNTSEAAIVCRADDLDNFIMKSCEFQSTTKPGGNGAGIYVMSNTADSNGYYVDIHNFELTNCTFNQSVAAGYGGAMCLMGYVHKGLITGCTFTNCESSGQSGGAIDLSGNMGAFTIQNTTFSGCTSKYRGGAIAIRSTNIKNSANQERWTHANSITISGCTFTNCESTDSHGGGIAVQAQLHTLKVSNCGFEGCKAKINGGGISIDGQDLPNTFANSGNTNPNWAAEITCTECTGYGSSKGGHKNWGSELEKTKTIDRKSWIDTVSIDSGCTFTNCSAASNGGSIEFASGCYITKSATISGATIDGSKALGEGSAIFWSHCYVKLMNLTGSTIQNCSFSGASSLAGGTVKTTGNTTLVLNVDGCTFTNNTSHHHGGGLYWNAARGLDGLACKATVNNCLFEKNVAAEYGGGIYVESDITITKCHIKYNTAGTLGGGIAQQVYNNPGARMLTPGGVSELKLDPSTWVHHNTAKNGGGISIRANETGSIEDGKPIAYTVRFELNGAAVYQNTATNNGGGIYFIAESYEDSNKQAEVDNYTKVVLINAGTGTAAAVYKNTAANNGGGIYMESSENTELRVQGGYISSNQADSDGNGAGNGGGIYMTGKNATCYVEKGIIGGEGDDSAGDPLANTAICGGGIAISGGATINMTGGEISYNNVGTVTANNHQGGGIWLDNKADDGVANSMTLSGGTVKNNSTPGGTGSDGGGIFVGEYGSFTITNGYVQNNTSNSWGGGLYASPNTVVLVSGGEISGNTTVGSGGGIYALEATVTVSEGAVKDNRAVYGGGIYASKSTINVTNSVATVGTGGSISGNIATSRGGGIGAYNGSIVTVSGGSIEGNWSFKGAGLYVNAASLTVNGGYISENGLAVKDGDTQYARTDMGGGIYGSGNATVTVKGGNVNKNEARMGGGIWVEDPSSSLSVYGGEIRENTATDAGGGIGVSDAATALVSSSEDGKTSGVITKNVASRGGGVYVANGADLTVTNGYITYNIANGKPSGVTTANGLSDTLAGTGGGVYIANGTSSNSTTFTLNGQSYAIYGNLAQFAADDVFANGVDTQLNVPQVKEMDLSEYEFNPEGWFEDYPANDTAYSSGLNLAASDSGIKNGNVFRYRGSEPEERVLINDSYIDSDGNTATKNVNDADVYVCMTLGMPAAVSDTVVIDYGKPVDIHVLVNEQMTIANATLVGIGPWHAPKEGVYGYPVLEDTFVKNKDEVYDVIGVGTAVVTNDGAADPANGVVRYTPDNMSMTKEVTFSYAVRYTNSKDADNKDVYFYYYADVTIIPATIIYYEDDFAEGTSGGIRYGVYNASNKETITDAAAQWMDTVEDYTDSTIQDEDRPGKALVPAIDKDRVYGYDSHYTSCATYSLGNAKKVTVDSSKYATATFTFWGTGFDVISMTSGDTGTIGVSIKTLKDGKETTTNYLVDTYYGYTYTEGGEWVVDKNSSDALYQIPVIKVMGLDYAQHTVTITATYADFFNHKGDSSYDLYLDAIRIYDPANNGVKADGSVNEVVQGAYKDDGECWPTYQELRDLIITKGDFGSIQESGGTKEGALFIDGVDSVGKGKISDYINCGPNNEVYLAPGQVIAFTLGNSDILAKIQLALKSASGNSVNYSIKSSAVSYETINVVATGTDMYQDITNMKGSTVVIKNTSAADSGCILSITNIKTTYTQTPPVTSEAGIVYVDESTGTEALAMLAADEEIQQPEQNVPGSGSEQNPATGDVGVEMMTVLVLMACVGMLAVLVVPAWHKRSVR